MKITLSLLVALIVTLSSCGIHIQKRLYRNGFYVSTHDSREAQPASPNEKSVTLQPVPSVIVPDTSVDEPDRIAMTDEDSAVTPAVIAADTLRDNDEQQPAREPVVSVQKESPPEEVPATEMERTRTLYIVSIAILCSWLILSPLSIIASLVLSLIILKRIRMLRAGYSPTSNQQVQLEKYRTFQVIALIAALVALALILLSVALIVLIYFAPI